MILRFQLDYFLLCIESEEADSTFRAIITSHRTATEIRRCPGGESVEDITARVDKVIAQIQEIHRNYWENGVGKQDIMIFSHGTHFIQICLCISG